MRTFYFFFAACVCLASGSPPLMRSTNSADPVPDGGPVPLMNATSPDPVLAGVPAPLMNATGVYPRASRVPESLMNDTSDVDIPESTTFRSVSKMPLVGGVRLTGSLTATRFRAHTSGSRKAHDALEHVVRQLDDKNTTNSTVEQALELMQLSLADPLDP